MPKKIMVIEVREYVYVPDPEDYADEIEGEFTIDKAITLDQVDVSKKKIKLEDLVDEIRVVNRIWRVIDEP